MTQPIVWSVGDLHRMTGVSKHLIRVQTRTGRIPGAQKIGGHWVYDPKIAVRWVEAENEFAELEEILDG